jgi:glutamate-1-semialdehyde aminotransferase
LGQPGCRSPGHDYRLWVGLYDQLAAEAPVTFRQAAQANFERTEAFRLAMLDAGILLPPFVITDSRLCLASSEDDIDQTIEAAARAFKQVA